MVKTQEKQVVQCSRCFKHFWKENMHLSFAGYRYCRGCWQNVGLLEKLFKR